MSRTFVYPLGRLGHLSPIPWQADERASPQLPRPPVAALCVLPRQRASLQLWAVFGKNLRNNN